jgi:hypothetical protein
MKPDFQVMSRKELRAYVLEHRDDDEAFYAYRDKSKAEGKLVKYPPLKSIDDLENYPEFIEKIRKEGEKYKNS